MGRNAADRSGTLAPAAEVFLKGRWCYLHRAIDSTGATINFVLSGLRDAATAKRLFRKALADPSHRQPRVINTDQARLYGAQHPGAGSSSDQTAHEGQAGLT